MDKNQLKLLVESVENARKVKDEYRIDFSEIETLRIYNSQIPLLAQQISESLPKIDLSHFVKSMQFALPEINYSQFIPKIDYSQLIKTIIFLYQKLIHQF